MRNLTLQGVYVRRCRFPPPVSEMCRYGEPFRGGSHTVVQFLAAVGRTPYAEDVSTFQEVIFFISWRSALIVISLKVIVTQSLVTFQVVNIFGKIVT